MANLINLRQSLRPVHLQRFLAPYSHQIIRKSPSEHCRPITSTLTCYSQQEYAGHNHAKHWTAERLLSLSMLGIIPPALISPNPILDYALALTVTVHAHWGLEAMLVDYIRPTVFGPIIPKVSIAMLYSVSVMTFGSLCYFNFADVGIGQAMRMLWAL